MRISLKRILTAMLAALSIATIFFSSLALRGGVQVQAADAPISASMTGDQVNLRSGAGMQYSIIGSLSGGELVTVLDDSDPNWAKVQTSSGVVGYCSKTYVKHLSSAQTGEGIGVLTGDQVNLRAGAGLSYRVLGTLALHETVTVLDSSDPNWVRVRTQSGKEGYCSAQYLQRQETDAAQGTAVTTDALNLRSGAGLGYRVQTVLQKGTTVTLLEGGDANWAKVRTANGTVGYCSRTYLQVDGAKEETPETTLYRAMTTDYLNLRSGAGLGHRVQTVLAKGAVVDVLDDSDANWVKVRTSDGTVGYCSRAYLQAEKAPTTVALSEQERTVTAGEGFTFTATVSDETLPTVVSNNAGAVQVTYAGRSGNVHTYQVETTQAGSAQITVRANGAEATLHVTVEAAPVPEVPQEKQATVNADVLNVRSGKGTNTAVLGTVRSGDIVTVLDDSDASWVQIRTAGGLTGYVAREYLNGLESTETPEAPQEKQAMVNADVLNVRSGKGTNTAVLGTVRSGDIVTVLDDSDASWVQIRTAGGLTGYVAREYLTLEQQENGGTKAQYAQVTADILNVRSGAGTGFAKIGSIVYGELVEVLEESGNGWVKIKTPAGLVGYAYGEYLEQVSENGVTRSVTIPAGKTYYAAQSSGRWISSDTSVVTASNGYITAVAPGVATVTGANGVTYTVTVTQGEAVRTAYAAPNIAAVGQAVELVAVTDTTRDTVQFRITESDGSQKIVDAYTYTTEECNGVVTRVWKATAVFGSAGKHSVTAYAGTNGVLEAQGFETDAYTVWSMDSTVASYDTRRISDSMIDLIARWEGYSATVYPDQLAGGVPTIGYGQTFGTGVQFYNNLSKTEAWSLLVKSINAGSYTSEVNRFLQSNGIRATQAQFDALVSFSYNIGAGYWNSTERMDLREIMLNAVVPPEIAQSSSLPATVTFAGARLYSAASRSASVLRALDTCVRLEVLQANYDSQSKAGWYKVRLQDGTEGYVCAGYARFDKGVQVTHDLNYTDANAFGSELLLWHHAGGNCYAGLVYRRMGEAKVFSYGDYQSATPGNYEYQRNTYGYDVPDCIRGKGWIKD